MQNIIKIIVLQGTEQWEKSRLNDWDDSRLKKLLEEAYSYKTPRDKENKSEMFLQLLQNAENEKEDQPFSFRAITSRFTRNPSSSATSSNSHNQHSHHPHHKQGGSLQDLVDAARNESLLDCDYGMGGQRNRRHNHNSRQKKYSSVSSRQREGGSLPSNVNATNSSGQPLFMHEVVKANSGGKQQRRCNAKDITTVVKETEKDVTAAVVAVAAATGATINNDDSGTGSIGSEGVCDPNGDWVIEMEEPMIDLQQQQHILESKGHDENTQGLPYYDRLDMRANMRIPRANFLNPAPLKTDFQDARTHCYIDETVCFDMLERSVADINAGNISGYSDGAGSGVVSGHLGIGANNIVNAAMVGAGGKLPTIDSTYLPLDENYKSVLGDKSELVKAPLTGFSTTKTITSQSKEHPTTQRQCDENGNSLNEASTSAATSEAILTNNSSQSLAKAKAKKKSQQERNTKDVDVKSFAGYRGNDPIEDLVKYIENTEDTKSNSNKFAENKKRERNKDKEKHNKKKKSNSLEELRSCAKIEVDDLKRTAATTESNVMMRQKGKHNKNNSSSDINKNFEASSTTATTTTASSVTKPMGTNTSRKGERRSWGTEELQYLGVSNNAEEKTRDKKICKNKEKDAEKDAKEQPKEKPIEKCEKNVNNAEAVTPAAVVAVKMEKTENADKSEKRKKIDELEQATIQNTKINAMSITYGDHRAMEVFLNDSAEFHVVTKKKRSKKQRGASMDDTSSISSSGACNRTQNLMANMPKQQMRNRSNNAAGSANNERVDYLSGNSQNAAGQYNTSRGAKSRRKSASSMPPSDKSECSDLDSVHSLPITTSKKKQRLDNTAATSATTNVQNDAASDAKNAPTPVISYADIARYNKELAAEAAIVDATNNNVATAAEPVLAKPNTDDIQAVASQNVNHVVSITSPTATNAANTSKNKLKKIKPDFPELVATTTAATTAVTAADLAASKQTGNVKLAVTYSQSLSATTTAVISSSDAFQHDPKDAKDEATTVSVKTTVRQHQIHQQQQPLQKSKSVEHESYNYNSNLDQQYPALEKTVKRHSATNVAATNIVSIAVPSSAGGAQFNFAAAAKQRLMPNNATDVTLKSPPIPTTLTTSSNNTTTRIATVANNTVNTANTSAALNIKRSKEKSKAEPCFFSLNAAAIEQTTLSPTDAYDTLPQNLTRNKNKVQQKEKHSQTNAFELAVIDATSTPIAPVNSMPVTVLNAAQIAVPIADSIDASSIIATTGALMTSTLTSPITETVAATVAPILATTTATTAESVTNVAQKSTTATQTHASISMVGSNKRRVIGKDAAAAGGTKISAKSSNAFNTKGQKVNASTSMAKTNSKNNNNKTASTTNTYRPAVIILNDDRAAGISNEFTFGDFNEEELRLFDDDSVAENEITMQNPQQDVDNPKAMSLTKKSKLLPNATATKKQILNESSCAYLDVIKTNQTAAVDAPTTSSSYVSNQVFNTTTNSISQNHNINSYDGSDNCENAVNTFNNNNNNNRITTAEQASNKLNTFLNTSSLASAAAARTKTKTARTGFNSDLPQQLETCNDIETAIIAAARAAAEKKQFKQKKLQQRENQQNSTYSAQENEDDVTEEDQNSDYYTTNSSSLSWSAMVGACDAANNAGSHSQSPISTRTPTPNTQDTINYYGGYHNDEEDDVIEDAYEEEEYEYENEENATASARSSVQEEEEEEEVKNDYSNDSPSVACNQNQHSQNVKHFNINFVLPPQSHSHLDSLTHDELVEYISSTWDAISNHPSTVFYKDD